MATPRTAGSLVVGIEVGNVRVGAGLRAESRWCRGSSRRCAWNLPLLVTGRAVDHGNAPSGKHGSTFGFLSSRSLITAPEAREFRW